MTDTTTQPKPVLGFRFESALLYAYQLHRDQTRKGGNIPYIGHLLGVASIVIAAGGNENQAIAALLHDAVEDQGGEARRQEIEQIFGERVAALVVASSDGVPGSDERSAENWEQRKHAYLNRLEHVADTDKDVLLVTLADKLHNARSLRADHAQHGDSIWSRFNQTDKLRQEWYYRGLLKIFQALAAREALGVAGPALVTELTVIVTAIFA